jgi:hypothetical protein
MNVVSKPSSKGIHRRRSAGPAVLAVATGLLLLFPGCKSRPSGEPSPASSASALVSAPSPSADAQAAPPAAPPDVDARALERQLGCPSRRHSHACKIAREFAEATRTVAQVPSGEGRFFGYAYRVERGAEKPELEVLAVTNVPANPDSPTDLPFRIAVAALPKDKRRDGQKLARALAHGDTVSRANKALPFVQTWTSENGKIAMSTAGTSVRLIAEEATFARQGSGQRLLLIRQRLAAPGAAAAAGDGTYVALWPVKW